MLRPDHPNIELRRRHGRFRASIGALLSVPPSRIEGAEIFLVLSPFGGRFRKSRELSSRRIPIT